MSRQWEALRRNDTSICFTKSSYISDMFWMVVLFEAKMFQNSSDPEGRFVSLHFSWFLCKEPEILTYNGLLSLVWTFSISSAHQCRLFLFYGFWKYVVFSSICGFNDWNGQRAFLQQINCALCGGPQWFKKLQVLICKRYELHRQSVIV